MRTHIILLYLIFIFSSNLLAQLHDNTWIFGYDNNTNLNDKYGISILTFPDGQLSIQQNTILDFNYNNTNTAFSDSTGMIQCYTNGVHIGNADWEIMEGGDFILDGDEEAGQAWPQYATIVPWPDKTE